MALGEVATRDYLRAELRDLADEIAERLSEERTSRSPEDGPSIGA